MLIRLVFYQYTPLLFGIAKRQLWFSARSASKSTQDYILHPVVTAKSQDRFYRGLGIFLLAQTTAWFTWFGLRLQHEDDTAHYVHNCVLWLFDQMKPKLSLYFDNPAKLDRIRDRIVTSRDEYDESLRKYWIPKQKAQEGEPKEDPKWYRVENAFSAETNHRGFTLVLFSMGLLNLGAGIIAPRRAIRKISIAIPRTNINHSADRIYHDTLVRVDTFGAFAFFPRHTYSLVNVGSIRSNGTTQKGTVEYMNWNISGRLVDYWLETNEADYHDMASFDQLLHTISDKYS